jgi:hypothetical protein
MPVTFEDLRSGAVLRVTEVEYCMLCRISRAKAQRDRITGRGIAYLKDPDTGRIYYEASAILGLFEKAQVCRSTSDYDTEILQLNLEKARSAKSSKSKSSDAGRVVRIIRTDVTAQSKSSKTRSIL